MSVVRGSKQDKLMVVAHDPWSRFWHKVFVIIFLIIISVASYAIGRFSALEVQKQTSGERDQLQGDLQWAQDQLQTYTQRVAVLEKGGEVDRKSTEGLRKNLVDLRSQIATLQEEVAFYKGLMAPASRKHGLRIQNIELEKTLEERRFRYKVMMTQVGSNQTYIAGLAAVNITGALDGKQKTFALRDLSKSVKDFGIKFRFRYFQEIEGDLIIPKDFEPEIIEVVLQSKGAKASRVAQTFPWPGKEETSVGQ